jgi:MFS family permease
VERRPHAVAAGLALAYSLALLGDNMMYVFLPARPDAAGITAASLGIVLSANRFVRLATNSLGGLVSDRFGRRAPYLAGMVLALASTAGYLVSDSLWPLVVWRVVWGIAFSLISVGGIAIVLDLSRAENRGRAVGGYSSLIQLGALLGFVLSGVLTDVVGYRGTLAIYVPLAAIGLGVALWTLRTAPAPMSSAATPAPEAARDAGAGLGMLAAVRRLDRRLLVPAYANFVNLFAGSGVVMATLAVSLKQLAAEPGVTLAVPVASLTGMLLAIRRLAGMVEAPIAGYLLDRLGDRRIVAVAGALVSLAGLVVLAGSGSVAAVIVGVALKSIGDGFLHPAIVVWTGDGAPPHLRGVIMGGLATAGDLGSAIGPLVAYALLEISGLRAAYVLCAVLMLSALAPLAIVRPASALKGG